MSTLASPDLAQVVAAIVARHGVAILDERNRLLGLLRDYAPDDLRAVRVLMLALDAGVLARFRALDRRPTEADIAQEAARLLEAYGTGTEVARAAARTWAAVASGAREPVPAAAAPGPPPVRPLPPPPVQALPAAAPAQPKAWQRWAAIITAVVLIVTGLLRLFGA